MRPLKGFIGTPRYRPVDPCPHGCGKWAMPLPRNEQEADTPHFGKLADDKGHFHNAGCPIVCKDR